MRFIIPRMFIRKYFAALWGEWLTLMSGIASIVLAYLAAYLTLDIPATRAFLWLASLACFIFASYRIWLKEHKKTLELQERIDKTLTPQLEAEILVRASGEYKDNLSPSTALTYVIEITNKGANSVAKDWGLVVSAVDGMTFTVFPSHAPQFTLGIDGMQGRVLDAKDNLNDKTFKPLTNGETIRGFLLFVIPIDRNLIDVEGTKAIIRYKDSQGKNYELFDDFFPSARKQVITGHIPGMEMRIEPTKIEEPIKRKGNKKQRWRR